MSANRGIHAVGGLFVVDGILRLALPKPTKADVSGDAVQPTANRLGVAKQVQPPMRSQKGLLSEVFRLGRVAHHAQDVPADAIAVSREECARVGGIAYRLHTPFMARDGPYFRDHNHLRG